jgi:hypothetical protein
MTSPTEEDWAADVAGRIVGDIPHAVFVRWATDVPERVAAMLRLELRRPSQDAELNAFAEGIVRALPDYLPDQTAARLRAKLLGALLTAGALGLYLRAPGVRIAESGVTVAQGAVPDGQADP